MAKAALEAIGELDLFGSRGSEASVIHVMNDQVAQCDVSGGSEVVACTSTAIMYYTMCTELVVALIRWLL